MKVVVTIMLRPGVLDPQGQAVQRALASLGFEEVREVRQGKVIELDLALADREEAELRVREMCERLLANTVIESYRIDLP
ncbi:phosphoribosylformylglycinamidine synthase subunit PurS [Rubellimicrobium sp. CFH 75288]|uniref:phosphoribosylformylglycinamidine synthase subunit PurS n=1 Tax=Rubellimicrobium sp. CFH 75288 TaxID=2697034 RepID=UPI00141215DC|nr:phosphoribosylformylglycinamidine synthase subunit PurS [Rubellimicrobium sp. CFH 75288]NAZ35237.1 phosphoribosylformylglycinamidine synthase subunit PurS [Rubellimicrobium sp. CFH 75288]